MATNFLLFCASALFIQIVSGHKVNLSPNLVYELGGGSSAASSAASASAARDAAAASAAAASAAAVGGEAASSSAATAGASAATSSAGDGASFAGLPDYNIVYSGPLVVRSSSPVYPCGLFVSSVNALEGPLRVTGTMPFLSAVSFEGSLPTAGSGVATCGCGSDNIGIIEELASSKNCNPCAL